MKRVSLLLLLLGAPATTYAQPGKILRFAQIAFGGGYETVINVTNRGTAAFNGRLNLLPSDPAKPFPALVNGTPVSTVSTVLLDPGATASLRITSGDASAGTVSGYAFIGTPNPETDSLLEGNLTYYVKSADGTILDSVGVAPSMPVTSTAVPFDDFETVALALANLTGADLNINLTLLDDKNARIGGTTLTLAKNQQVPKFLYQIFPGASLQKGRVEIQAAGPFIGSALTFAKGGQASSLPFPASTNLYELTLNFVSQSYTGHVYITFEAAYASGYVVDVENGVPLQPFSEHSERIAGFLVSGNLELFSHSSRGKGDEDITYVLIPGFNPSKDTQSGTALIYAVNPPGVFGQTTVTVKSIR
jgi:hypothetical protein